MKDKRQRKSKPPQAKSNGVIEVKHRKPSMAYKDLPVELRKRIELTIEFRNRLELFDDSKERKERAVRYYIWRR